MQLDPAIEEDVALMTPVQRIAMAEQFERWARQLRYSALILKIDADRAAAVLKLSRRSSLRPVSRHLLWRN